MNSNYSEAIHDILSQEKENALALYGNIVDRYQGYGALKEEVEEVGEAANNMDDLLTEIWDHIRRKAPPERLEDRLLSLEDELMCLIDDAIQALAVAQLFTSKVTKDITPSEDPAYPIDKFAELMNPEFD